MTVLLYHQPGNDSLYIQATGSTHGEATVDNPGEATVDNPGEATGDNPGEATGDTLVMTVQPDDQCEYKLV